MLFVIAGLSRGIIVSCQSIVSLRMLGTTNYSMGLGLILFVSGLFTVASGPLHGKFEPRHENTCLCHMRKTRVAFAQSDQHLCCSLPRQWSIVQYLKLLNPNFQDSLTTVLFTVFFWEFFARKLLFEMKLWYNTPKTIFPNRNKYL